VVDDANNDTHGLSTRVKVLSARHQQTRNGETGVCCRIHPPRYRYIPTTLARSCQCLAVYAKQFWRHGLQVEKCYLDSSGNPPSEQGRFIDYVIQARLQHNACSPPFCRQHYCGSSRNMRHDGLRIPCCYFWMCLGIAVRFGLRLETPCSAVSRWPRLSSITPALSTNIPDKCGMFRATSLVCRRCSKEFHMHRSLEFARLCNSGRPSL
jgi:hypothetical protein